MDWKKFFKPTASKLIIALIIVLIWPNYFYMDSYCSDGPLGLGCHEVMSETIGIVFIPVMLYAILSGKTSETSFAQLNNFINFFASLIVSYIIASTIIFLYYKYKPK